MKQNGRIAELFAAALEKEPAARTDFLKKQCARSESLLAELDELLSAYDRAESKDFLSAYALELEAEHLAADDAIDSRVGQIFGHYKITERIGTGGMGAIYLAEREDHEFEKRVAVKIIKRGMDTDETLKRFSRERRILAALEHSNIARLIDGGTAGDGTQYLTMEYVEGSPIDVFCVEHRLSVEEKLRLFQKVCAAVVHAHRNLTIHRDLKSSNILVTEDGEPKLLDFGIAKLFSPENNQTNNETLTNFRALTPEYASPEQLRGEKLTTATDVYSLGVILYELLTGTRPFATSGKILAEVLRIVSEIQPTRPSLARNNSSQSIERRNASDERRTNPIDGDIDNIVLKALNKEPERRYGSVEQFCEDIDRHLKGLPVSARKDSFFYRLSKFVKRNPLASAASALLVLSLLGGFAVTFWQYRKAQAAQARAERRFNDVRGLANSLVFELNDDIEKGPTGARQKLVVKALEYLDSLSQEAQTDDRLKREIGETYLRIGDIQGRAGHANLGDTSSALASYRKAVEILEPLAKNNAQNQEMLISLSLAYENIGKIQTLGNEFASSLETHKKILGIRQNLLDFAPDNIKYRQYTAESLVRIGDYLQKISELAGKVENFQQSLENYQKALRTFEEISAIADFRRSREMFQTILPASPQNDEASRDSVNAFYWLGVGLAQDNKKAEARDNFYRQKRLLKNFLKKTTMQKTKAR